MTLRRLLNVAYADLASRAEDPERLDDELEAEPSGGPVQRRPKNRNLAALMAAAKMPRAGE